jgi:translocation and assembly module TamB
VEARALDLGRLAERLPPEVDLEGRLEADASGALAPDGAATGSLRVTVPEGMLRYRLDEEGVEAGQLAFAGTRVEGTLDAGGLGGTASLPLDPGGTLEAAFALPDWSPASGLPPGQPLRGRLEGQVVLPDALAALVPAIAEVAGTLDLALALAGTLGQPRLDGNLQLLDASVLAPAAGIHLEDIQGELRSTDLDRLGFTLQARSGEGQATVEGSVALDAAAGFPVEARIRGERFLATDLPEYRALVSPDLALQISGERMTLKGEMRVPEARIAPESLPEGAVAPSDDVRVLRGEEPVDEPPPVAVDADVTVDLGDDVRLDAFGLEARLAGRVRVRQPPQGVATASGQIRVEEGTYQAYGQDLDLSRGRLFYAGGPVENPGLDLRAERTVDDVVAGVQVTGTATSPEVSLYSEPPMEDAAVLSYLVLGRAPGEGGGGLSSQAITRALALTGGGRVLENLRDTLGFSELGLQEGETLEETSLVVGRQLGPGLYARLIAGALESTSILQLRYDVTKNLQLQTETGGRQGVDLFWTIER